MNDVSYKGYMAKIEYSPADGCLIGRILGIQDIITFHGDSVTEIHQAFEEAVDDYLDFCAKVGQAPQKPFSGKIMLRVPPEDHAKLALQAQVSGKSINALVIDALRQSGALES
ncbi:MAG: type II toxin-antitoxin system HicB family antitoxin [Deltaproteobacteria bacterium]|jgi:predicted HicB family RNase H-like nuclease|nr:type II toxin-antitoxin system HicB family antitoxin [Deltaproteobacteria bacterium]